MLRKIPFHFTILVLFILIIFSELLVINTLVEPGIKKTQQWMIEVIEQQGTLPYVDVEHLGTQEYRNRYYSDPPLQSMINQGRLSVYNSGKDILIFENPMNRIRWGMNNLLLFSLFLFISGYLLLLKQFNIKYIDPIHYLKELIQHEVYNLMNKPLEETEMPTGELRELTRGVKEVLTELKQRNKKLLSQSREFLRLSYTDGLTNLNNRAALNQLMEKEQEWLNPYEPVSFLMMDIDFFKQYNDNYGHLMGDDVLKAVAKILPRIFYSPNDFWARYGGEEFAVLLRNTSIGTAIKTGNRLLRGIESMKIPHDKSRISKYLTCSVGIATTIPGFYFDSLDLIETADEALYQAKEKGRNRLSALNPRYVQQELKSLHLI
ncbi:MAG: GGDEF domain-containing protein [Spirochaetaceae bacterium]|jgi:diguanylate cyclase (GGDEF)-like protein|nr:GGDEF domain-containing protein [Spirochaetaceae bacterium]